MKQSSTATSPVSKRSQTWSLSTSQIAASEYCLGRDNVLVIADKGAGKTRLGLFVAYESGGRVLIVCPNKVRQGWVDEGKRVGVDVTLVEGTPEQRHALLLDHNSDVLVMGADLLKWAGTTFKTPPTEGLIIDETVRFSKPGSVGTKVLRRWNKSLSWVLGLTAQPVMESPLALYGQMLVIDGGVALGRSFDRYKQRWFTSDWNGYKWEINPGADKDIAAACAGVIYHMADQAYADSLPPAIEELVVVEMPPAAWTFYNEMVQDALLEHLDIEAANDAVVSGKLEQLAQGAVYDSESVPHAIHFAKTDALRAMVEDTDEPLVIVYAFQYELVHLRNTFIGADLRDPGAKEAFVAGDIDILFMHYRSGAHGVDGLQTLCNEMIFTKPIWSADATDQALGRIRRRGQKRVCRRRTIVARGTVDEVILARVEGKEDIGGSLLGHLKEVAKTKKATRR